MVKIHLLQDPQLYTQFARFSHVGTWTQGEICQICGQGTQRLQEPLQIKWDPDSDVLGDFSWCGYTMVVTDEVRAFFQEQNFECNFGKVEILRATERLKGRKRVAYPYRGPQLHWVMPTDIVPLNLPLSKVPLLSDCPICEQTTYRFKLHGLVVDKAAWGERKLFKIREFAKSSAIYASDEAVRLILAQGFSNFAYVEVGVVE